MTEVLRKRPPFDEADAAHKRRARTSTFTISQRDFQKRVRFRDTQGYSYAVPLSSDAIYKTYVTNGTVDRDRNDDDNDNDNDTEVPLDGKRVMLYLRKPRTSRLVPLPSGTIELLDMATQKLYTATVSLVVVSQMNKPGHLIVEDLVDTGRRAKSSDFTGKRSSNSD